MRAPWQDPDPRRHRDVAVKHAIATILSDGERPPNLGKRRADAAAAAPMSRRRSPSPAVRKQMTAKGPSEGGRTEPDPEVPDAPRW